MALIWDLKTYVYVVYRECLVDGNRVEGVYPTEYAANVRKQRLLKNYKNIYILKQRVKGFLQLTISKRRGDSITLG